MSDSVWPHRWKPTRLPCPWDSSGKNTGVGCHYLLQCMKVKSEREVTQSCPTLSYPMDYSLPGSSIHGIFQARVLEWVVFHFSRESSQPRDRTQVSRIASGFFTIWATRDFKNIGMGSLSLLRQIFLMQELSWGILHCRWILYQLSYQRNPVELGDAFIFILLIPVF